MLNADIIVDVNFYNEDESPRKQPIQRDFFSCPFEIEGAKYDCRLLLKDVGQIKPGEFKFDVPVKFLCLDLVSAKLREGEKFYLWEGGYIAEGKIKKIIENKPDQK